MHFIFISTVGYRLCEWGEGACMHACVCMCVITCKQVDLLPSNISSVIANMPLRIIPFAFEYKL